MEYQTMMNSHGVFFVLIQLIVSHKSVFRCIFGINPPALLWQDMDRRLWIYKNFYAVTQ